MVPIDIKSRYPAFQNKNEEDQILDTICEMIMKYPITVDEILEIIKKAAKERAFWC